MKQSTKLSLIAAAMGGLMAGASSHALAASPTMVGSTVKTSAARTSTVVKDIAGIRVLDDSTNKGTHDCKGKNDCKGQGGCKTGDQGCKGKNSCKGNGGCSTKSKDGNSK